MVTLSSQQPNWLVKHSGGQPSFLGPFANVTPVTDACLVKTECSLNVCYNRQIVASTAKKVT